MNDAATPPLIVFLDRDSFPPDLPFERPSRPHRWRDYPTTAQAQIVERLAGASVVVTNKIRIGAEVMAACPGLKLIAVTATGTDIIDKAAAAERDIAVRNVVNYGPQSVAEHVMALLLTLSRQISAYREAVLDLSWTNSGQFCVFPKPVRDLRGRRLVLVGVGAIAQAVAERAQSFGMEIVFAERKGAPPRPGRMAFEAALASADVISLHCPLTPDTTNLLNRAAFAQMKPGVILINTARGGLIDEAALEVALDAGIVGAAGLDVTVVEPPPPGALILKLAARPEVIVTPHAAWASREAMTALLAGVSANIDAYLAQA